MLRLWIIAVLLTKNRAECRHSRNTTELSLQRNQLPRRKHDSQIRQRKWKGNLASSISPPQLLNATLAPRKLESDDEENCVSTYIGLRTQLELATDSADVRICCGATINFHKGYSITIRAHHVFLGCDCPENQSYWSDGDDENSRCVLDKNGFTGRLLSVVGDGVTIRGITFQGADNRKVNGGALYLGGGGTNTIVLCTFRRNQGRNGGAIYANSRGITVLRRDIFEDNFAQRRGGAVFLRNGNSKVNKNSRGAGNDAEECRGVYYADTRSCDLLRLDDPGCIENCEVLQKSLNRGDQSMRICSRTKLFCDRELVLWGTGRKIFCEERDCVLDGSRSRGRIMRIVGDKNEITGLTFASGNARSSNGGALLLLGNKNEIMYCNFNQNKAKNGGAIASPNDVEFTIFGSNFYGNWASNRGGVAYVRNSFTSIFADISNTGIGNSAQDCRDLFNVKYNSCEDLTMTTNVERGSFVDVFDRNYDDDSPIVHKLRIDCVQTCAELNNRLSWGGGTMYICADSPIVCPDEIMVTGNRVRMICEAEGERCVISRVRGKEGRIMSVTGNNNEFVGLSFRHGFNPSGNGGAMRISGKNNAITDCDFTSNDATNGGAIYVEPFISITVVDSIFQGNSASMAGGAVYMHDQDSAQLSEEGNKGVGNGAKICEGVFNNYYSTCDSLRP